MRQIGLFRAIVSNRNIYVEYYSFRRSPNSQVFSCSLQGGPAMGRGRAKAKQTKVARQLKYNTPNMDLDSLQRELAGKSPNSSDNYENNYSDEYAEDDQYGDYSDWEKK
ncbi:Hypothetical protein CpMEX30_1807 [Corynebacterium pseudotuberculosis]|uniref:DUF3073 family protein n=4 Tax=Corynebacterium TaxID=1716 RepID=D9QC97_CORP2|nr:DUF3073 family protein [Corynebacterium pseudotuberculosis C231]ADL21587.1 DUF3073 domain-containing protein [Corynebacterium pseudotuberculosis 1002]ADO26982.1 DUF3073 family protein [Corynebacterium pseudotuberculosis I19]AEK93046.1 Hypothetical protein CpPAT10_1721 [Corynebacterium pseudotuberculosis PAT10]AEP70950.1 Hypothetical protein Cp4202_1710 [Corynebacterium pseudotuberculosis 42/02-A]AEQ07252.1 DUF3073 family protein [Corynebacterium pseudotuberculosis CIP 52.97]AFB73069.1 DUF3